MNGIISYRNAVNWGLGVGTVAHVRVSIKSAVVAPTRQVFCSACVRTFTPNNQVTQRAKGRCTFNAHYSLIASKPQSNNLRKSSDSSTKDDRHGCPFLHMGLPNHIVMVTAAPGFSSQPKRQAVHSICVEVAAFDRLL